MNERQSEATGQMLGVWRYAADCFAKTAVLGFETSPGRQCSHNNRAENCLECKLNGIAPAVKDLAGEGMDKVRELRDQLLQ